MTYEEFMVKSIKEGLKEKELRHFRKHIKNEESLTLIWMRIDLKKDPDNKEFVFLIEEELAERTK